MTARAGFPGFRFKITAAMMALVVVLTGVGLVLVERNAAAAVERDLQAQFRGALTAFETARETRGAALAARCLALVRKSRIHAALEDDALDLLYPSARDELHDLMSAGPLHARFYRFLDARGRVIPTPDHETGPLSADHAATLALRQLPDVPQLGFLVRTPEADTVAVDEIITTPIRSTVTNRPIAALVVGFPTDLAATDVDPAQIQRGVWLNQQVHLPRLDPTASTELARILQPLCVPGNPRHNAQVTLAGKPYLLLCQELNPDSQYPTAAEIALCPLAPSLARQRSLRVRIVGGGLLLLCAGFVVTHVLATRLSRPVEKLAADSQASAAGRREAEASLQLTKVELQRAARFSADASHQLKTPVAVLRAGLQELLARDDLAPPVRAEIALLFEETHRFTSMIEDLLLLSRMDAGRLALELSPIDLAHLVASWLDDLSVQDDGLNLEIENELPAELLVAGERRYTWHILVNLLENARRYNRPHGRIRIAAQAADGYVRLAIGNTGPGIPPPAQAHIFERFHRGGASAAVPGHGLGLNLARELATLHGGELRLVRSADDWTEFEVTFRAGRPAALPVT